MNKSLTNKTEGQQKVADPYDTPEKVFACARKLIQAYNKSANEHNAEVDARKGSEDEKLPLIKANNKVETNGLAITFSILHIPNSRETLGVDTAVLALTVVYDQDRTVALNSKDFSELMRSLEHTMRLYAVDYTEDSLRQGYYTCMHEYEKIQTQWAGMLDCHRTFLIHTMDTKRLSWLLCSDEMKETLADYNHKLYGNKFVEKTTLTVQIPGHHFTIHG